MAVETVLCILYGAALLRKQLSGCIVAQGSSAMKQDKKSP
jgi:hypothetical protein